VQVTDAKGARWVRVPGKTTYTHQLEAFLAAINGGCEMLTMGNDLIANMAIIDTVYQVAGMPTRQPL
jgi:7-keto-8-aminopelargonate synthetase-like enzyme